MKKNRTMRIAAVMLVLALFTTCIISGSFAKYVTTGTAGSDNARVAAWGVTVTPSSSLEVFETEYNADDPQTSLTTTVSADDAVVAPGTKKDGVAAITLSGTPEVAVRVAYSGTFDVTGWNVDGAFYCPLIIKFNSGDNQVTFNGLDYASEALFEKAVNDQIIADNEDYEPGTNLSTLNAGKVISWEWVFEADADNTKNDDTKDTALGNLATAPTVSISLSVTVTQID